MQIARFQIVLLVSITIHLSLNPENYCSSRADGRGNCHGILDKSGNNCTVGQIDSGR